MSIFNKFFSKSDDLGFLPGRTSHVPSAPGGEILGQPGQEKNIAGLLPNSELQLVVVSRLIDVGKY